MPAAVRTISSTVVNGLTEHRLVNGGAYSVRLSYQDTFGHPPATHWIQRYEMSGAPIGSERVVVASFRAFWGLGMSLGVV